MKRIAPAVVLITLLQAVWPAWRPKSRWSWSCGPARSRMSPARLAPEKVACRRAGPQTGRGHRADPAGDQRHQADHHDPSAGEGQGHQRRGRDLQGGGYWDLYWELEGEEVAAWLNAHGVTGIILKYRVPRRPDEPKGEPGAGRCRMPSGPSTWRLRQGRRLGH